MSQLPKCSVCGAFLPVDSPGGHCQSCLLQLGMGILEVIPAVRESRADEATSLQPGGRIRDYRLLQQIGEGGCGLVFLAEQEKPVRRRVALKLVRPGSDTPQGMARFEAERQVLALLDHANIPKFFDAGTTESGRPFFVMELVRGVKITEYCDREKLSIRERLELFAQVCHALNHAHQKGIIHRDLKPANILVTESEDGRVRAPKIIDFGIAKSTDQTLTGKELFTEIRHCLGTPAYMSPEQAGGNGVEIDTRSDIYSLGVLLYELLTGLAPFEPQELNRWSSSELLWYIRDVDAPAPSVRLGQRKPAELANIARLRRADAAKLAGVFRGDLDWIILKCMERDRKRRYETAYGLAVDVERYLSNEPVKARSPGKWYCAQKMIRRNLMAVEALTVVILALLSATGVSLYQAARAQKAQRAQERLTRQTQVEEEKARAAAVKSQETLQFLVNVLKGAGPSVALGRDSTLLHEMLDHAAKRLSRDLGDQPDVQAELCNILSETYYELGLYQSMEAMARMGLALSQPRPEVANLTAAKSLEQLGDSLMHLGKLDQAELVSREALDMRRKLLGPEDLDVSASLDSLGLVLRQKGKYGQAEKMFRESLAMDHRLINGDDLRVASVLGNLGATLWNEGKFTESELDYRESLRQERAVGGEETVDTAILLDDLATVLSSEHKFGEAEALYRQGLSLERKFFGNHHADVAIALGNLGKVLVAQGRLTEAEAADREALAINVSLSGKPDAKMEARLDDLRQDIAALGRRNETQILHLEASTGSKGFLKEQNEILERAHP
jgi:serine/threonine protein kinase/tetratricopeptide (TPR) repeat protein